MEQFEQLLTCAICLDRYRNPKLLPCQHSFCMEPCMDGLVDYVRRQVKCPECRAEHRIPYQGVQAFPTNVTLQRFLELHIEITGELPDPTSGQTMERCGVCSEKSYCSLCVHCDKKCCPECKDAHMDILRREITRINSQIRRGLHRLQDALALVEKNTLGLQTNCASVAEEVDEIYRRLSKALKDRTEHLRNEVERYSGTELRSLIQLKENLELEIANIQSNCDLADAHINENVPWDDAELLDTKELFLRTVEFIRNFEYEAGDYGRRVRFVMAHDPNQLVLHVAGYGELNIKPETGSTGHLGTTGGLAPPGGPPGLMRSKSDHRLASQYRQQEEERLTRNRYAPDYEYDTPEYETPRNKSRYRSRFMRHRDGEESDGDTRSSVRFTSSTDSNQREKVLDTEDAARGPLSGIFRLTDSPRVMKKLQECERASKRKKDDPPAAVTPTAAPTQTQTPKTQVQPKKNPSVAKQTSEDDEISRIKKQNKNNPSQTETVEERQSVPATPTSVSSPVTRESERETEEVIRRPTIVRRTSSEAHAPGVRSASSDSSTGSESSTGSGIRSTGATFTAEEMKQKYLSRAPPSSTNTTSNVNSVANPTTNVTSVRENAVTTTPSPRPPFQSRFLGAGNRSSPAVPTPAPIAEPKKEEDDETSSSSEETETETEESETETRSSAAPSTERTREVAMARTDIGPLLARSAEARRGSKEESPSTRYSSPRGSPALSTSSPTGMSSPSGYTSRFVAIAHDNHDLSSNSVNTLDNNVVHYRSVINQSDDALLLLGDSVDNNQAAYNNNHNNNDKYNYDNSLTGEKILASNEHYSSVPSIVITPDDNKFISVNNDPDLTLSLQDNNNNGIDNDRRGTDYELDQNILGDNLTRDYYEQSDSADNQPEALTIRSDSYEMGELQEPDNEGARILSSITEEIYEDNDALGRDGSVDQEVAGIKSHSQLVSGESDEEIVSDLGNENSIEVNDEKIFVMATDQLDSGHFSSQGAEVDNRMSDDKDSDELSNGNDSEEIAVRSNDEGMENINNELMSNEKLAVMTSSELDSGNVSSESHDEISNISNEGHRNFPNEISVMKSEDLAERISHMKNNLGLRNVTNELNGENHIANEEFSSSNHRESGNKTLETDDEKISEGMLTDTEDLGEILSSVVKSAKKMEREYLQQKNHQALENGTETESGSESESESESMSESELQSQSENAQTYSRSNDISEMSSSFSTNQSDKIDDIFNKNSINDNLFDDQGWIVTEEDPLPLLKSSSSTNSISSNEKTDFFINSDHNSSNFDNQNPWNSLGIQNSTARETENNSNFDSEAEIFNNNLARKSNNGWLANERNNNSEQSTSEPSTDGVAADVLERNKDDVTSKNLSGQNNDDDDDDNEIGVKNEDDKIKNESNQSRMDNINIPMQMVTTVFCVSVLCYGVLTNLFL
ncbi:probable serine/threonine-protein kinase DDB_G0282963 isoform X2 [Microplitis demolitor]|uniref:probable serine/threonine-protein kinase DDB_G0282963 isoform X2 n=1 Tax=Microplitis demolitor TaxID=69319 RepID=UPI00235B6EF1|nr:probable serine/threonine-protein kinase DDB_G0282963 isoform X2 [Microplitis demolitor]